jgi:hypothetical protein
MQKRKGRSDWTGPTLFTLIEETQIVQVIGGLFAPRRLAFVNVALLLLKAASI